MANEINKLAIKLKGYESPSIEGIMVGVVVQAPPEILIRIDEDVMLDKNNSIFAKQIIQNSKRNIRLKETKAIGSDSDGNLQTTIGFEEGEITFNDTFKVGDKLIVIPTSDMQKYFIIDWAVNL